MLWIMHGAQDVVRLEVAGGLAAAAMRDGRVHVWDPGQVCFGSACKHAHHVVPVRNIPLRIWIIERGNPGAGGVPACLLPA